MPRTILLRLLAIGWMLLAPATTWAQQEVAPPPETPLLGPAAPLPDALPGPTPLLSEEKARPAPTSSTDDAVNPPGAGFGGMFGGFDPRTLSVFRSSFNTTWFPSEGVSGQPGHLGYLQDDFSLSAPLYHDGCDTWAVSIRGRNETFSTQAFLTQSNRSFPSDLWDLNFGTTYAHTFDNGWIAGGTVSVGSASDQVFHSIEEMYMGVSAFLRVPSGERNAWMFSVSYSPTSELAFPIPMVSYIYNPSDYLRINIGLPFQVMYRPTEDLTLNFSYMLLRNVHAQAAYRLSPLIRAHVGFDWGNESYFLADRENVNDRLFYYDMRASAGLLFTITNHFSIDLLGGYVFDRFYFVGAEYSDKNTNELDVGSGPYLSLQGHLRW